MIKINSRCFFLILITSFIFSCGQPQEAQTSQQPVIIESGDECHLCGMIITRFPGPKGEAFIGNQSTVRKFCSTQDLFAWFLQPENKPNTKQIFVHDMTQTDWDKPDDTKLIDARKAFYVIGSSRQGSMGKTLASFETIEAANDFGNQWGGKIIKFKEITTELLMQ